MHYTILTDTFPPLSITSVMFLFIFTKRPMRFFSMVATKIPLRSDLHIMVRNDVMEFKREVLSIN